MSPAFEKMQFQINDVITELNGLLNFCQELDQVQKQSVTSVGSVMEPFLHRTYRLSQEKPDAVEVLEGYEKFMSSYNLWNLLTPVQAKLEKILSDVNDTRLMAGNNALISALDMYDELAQRRITDKDAWNISVELRDYFPRSQKLPTI